MQPLRRARALTRFVLVWFALFIAAAAFSPVFADSAPVGVCSASASSARPSDGPAHPAGLHALKCPLCMSMQWVPPWVPPAIGAAAPVPEYVLRSIPAARVAAPTGAPLPARGPPASITA